MSGELAIDVRGVTRTFGAARALDDVSFSINAGEIVSLIGQSGCGKSTLLRILSGVDYDHHGSVDLFGKAVANGTIFVEPEIRNVGYMLQDYALFPHLSVEENILFGVRKLPHPTAKDRADRIIQRLSIGHLRQKYPHMLSGGEQQRVALARALTPEPAIILMDEPFSNLDRRLADVIRFETLAILRELSTTAIIVTHDPEEALSSSDRIALMRDGKVLQMGTPYELYFHPQSRYIADYFCAYNKIPGVVDGKLIKTAFGEFPAPFNAPLNTAVTAYLRPQSIAVSRDGTGLPGTIINRTFFGDAEELLIAVEGKNTTLRARTPIVLPGEGSQVQIKIPSIGVLVFKD